MPSHKTIQGDLPVPKIRRCPDSYPADEWRRFVKELFPELPSSNHQAVRVGYDPTTPLYDVIRYKNEKSSEKSPELAENTPLFSCETIVEKHRVLIRNDQPGENRCDCTAFRSGVYGTCSHIHFVLDQLRNEHGDSWNALFQERSYSEIFLKHGLVREIVFRDSPEIPKNVRKWANRCFDANGRLRFDQAGQLKMLLQQADHERHEIRVDDDVFGQIARRLQQQNRKQDILALFPKGASSHPLDALLKIPLAAYQREAAMNAAIAGRFLLFDMAGFGKRQTAVATSEILTNVSHVGKVLILTNTATMHTWSNVLRQAVNRESLVVFGSPQRRAESWSSKSHYLIARYDDLIEDADQIIARWQPELLILDEAHTLKKHGTETARMVRRLDTEHLLILSGIDPSRMPGPFLSFVDMIDSHRSGILETFLERHQIFNPDDDQIQYVNMGRVGMSLPNHFRRRETRHEKKSLPLLVEHERFLPITEEQAKHHADLQSQLFRIALPLRDMFAPRQTAGDPVSQVKTSRRSMTHFFGRLTESLPDKVPLEDMPGDREPDENAEGNAAAKESSISNPESAFPDLPVTVLYRLQTLIDEMLRTSNDMALVDPVSASGCKSEVMLEVLRELLETGPVKAVVFANEPEMLFLAAKYFEEHASFGHVVIDQGMTPHRQKASIHTFQCDENCRILFATDGVLGRLTFHQVSLLLNLDRPWNLDGVKQRLSHVTTGGTLRPLHVYHLVSCGTIEHALAKLSGQKPPLTATNMSVNRSVVLLDAQERLEYFKQIAAMLDLFETPPMVIKSGKLKTKSEK
ncbi:MAG: DEAD/DEAH box helicase [Planctomycetaceae bacterium]|nr:DEAD/DEAH box helicase [Planctomycetaceae bacterium]